MCSFVCDTCITQNDNVCKKAKNSVAINVCKHIHVAS